jgi:serine/threonine-protein kinase
MESTFFLLSGGVAAYVTHALKRAFAGVAQRLEQHALFGKYRLEREIGAGGFGVVWAATYCPAGGFERPAAVKMVHANLADDDKLIAAFRAEAELGARLVHGNIVQVFDFGRVDDTYFFAMEFVDGDTLSHLLKRARAANTRIPAHVACAIADDLLAALHHAHAEARDSLGRVLRVIHRDLGPANLIVSTSGVTKLADFGIARALRGSQAAATTTVVGHVDHMAPEQLNGEPLDPRCDLFAAGVLLWEMLCGRALFRRESDGATIAAVLRSEIPAPSSVHADLAPLDAVVLRALERDRDRRFASALEMKRALEAALARGTADDVARFVSDLAAVPTPAEAAAVTESAPRAAPEGA